MFLSKKIIDPVRDTPLNNNRSRSKGTSSSLGLLYVVSGGKPAGYVLGLLLSL